jgi:hypothetical protein
MRLTDSVGYEAVETCKLALPVDGEAGSGLLSFGASFRFLVEGSI